MGNCIDSGVIDGVSVEEDAILNFLIILLLLLILLVIVFVIVVVSKILLLILLVIEDDKDGPKAVMSPTGVVTVALVPFKRLLKKISLKKKQEEVRMFSSM